MKPCALCLLVLVLTINACSEDERTDPSTQETKTATPEPVTPVEPYTPEDPQDSPAIHVYAPRNDAEPDPTCNTPLRLCDFAVRSDVILVVQILTRTPVSCDTSLYASPYTQLSARVLGVFGSDTFDSQVTLINATDTPHTQDGVFLVGAQFFDGQLFVVESKPIAASAEEARAQNDPCRPNQIPPSAAKIQATYLAFQEGLFSCEDPFESNEEAVGLTTNRCGE